jgi:hypothetical protein
VVFADAFPRCGSQLELLRRKRCEEGRETGGHSRISFGGVGCLVLQSAAYWNMVVATRIHLAWSLPIPLWAVAHSLSSCCVCVCVEGGGG